MVISSGYNVDQQRGNVDLPANGHEKNSVDGFADVLTFGSSQNNSCFLEKQLLLVKRAQEMLLDEYRTGNSSKLPHNRPTYPWV